MSVIWLVLQDFTSTILILLKESKKTNHLIQMSFKAKYMEEVLKDTVTIQSTNDI